MKMRRLLFPALLFTLLPGCVTSQMSTGAPTGMVVTRVTPASRSPRKHGRMPIPIPAEIAAARLISVLAMNATSTCFLIRLLHHLAAV